MKFFLIVFLIQSSAQAACVYSFVKDSQKLTWTGYKFTNKKGVPGTFKDIGFSQSPSKSLSELIKSVKFTVKTNSLDSGNTARDATLKAAVFNLLKVPQEISGKILSVEQDKANVELTFNETFNLPFLYEIKDKSFTATGSLDLLSHGLKPNYDAVHASCEKLHTGEDGVSKTWSTVDLKVSAQIEEQCSFLDKIKKYFSKN